MPPAHLACAGAEDALGDMDFKVAGDENGITAFQVRTAACFPSRVPPPHSSRVPLPELAVCSAQHRVGCPPKHMVGARWQGGGQCLAAGTSSCVLSNLLSACLLAPFLLPHRWTSRWRASR